MIKFEDCFDEDYAINKVNSYFENNDLENLFKYSRSIYKQVSCEGQAEILLTVAKAYEQFGCFDKAITLLKIAISLDKENLAVYLKLADLFFQSGDKLSYQECMLKYGIIANDETKMQILQKAFDDVDSDDFKVVTPELKNQIFLQKIDELVAGHHFKKAIKLLEEHIEKENNKDIAYRLLDLYLKTNQEDMFCSLLFTLKEDFIDDASVLSSYIYMQSDNDTYDPQNDFDALLKCKIDDIDLLKKVVAIFDVYKKNDSINQILNEYEKNHNAKNCYDILMMKALNAFNMGDIAKTNQLLEKVEFLYGDLGIAKYYKDYLNSKIGEEVYCASYDKLRVDSDFICDLVQKTLTNPRNNQVLYLYNFAVLSENFLIIDMFFKTFENQISKMNQEDLMFVLNTQNIEKETKANIIKKLIDIGKVSFDILFKFEKNHIEFKQIDELKDFPVCYQEAYKYAFVYCALISDNFQDNLLQSTMELIEIMQQTKDTFANPKGLAGAIMCNSYAILSDDIVATVADIIGVSKNLINRYLNKIKQYGDYFDKDIDDLFFEQLKKIMSKYGNVDLFE